MARLILVISECRTTLLQAPFCCCSLESEITLQIYYNLKSFSSSGFSSNSLWYSANWFTGVGGSFVKHITRYKPVNITTSNSREILATITVIHIPTHRYIFYLCNLPVHFFASTESKSKAGIFLQNHAVTQAETLLHVQEILLTWKRT